MNILVLPSWFENTKNPTLGSFFKDQSIALLNLGHKVAIIHPNAVSFKGVQHWRPGKTCTKDGLPIYKSSYFTIPKLRQFNIWNRIKQYEKLYKKYIADNGSPDVLHAHSCALGPFGSAGLAAHYISKKYKIPFVITEHASSFHTKYYQKKEVPLIKQAFDNASSVVAVSESLANDLHEFGVNRNINIIGNIIDVDSFKLPEQPNESNHYTFVVVAYLRPIKQIDVIIKAFAKALSSNSNIRLKIIGNGEQIEELITLSKTLKVDNAVHFLGELPRSQVVKEMTTSDCYLLASAYETFSVAVHEALALGKSVISSSCGGPEPTIKTLKETILPSFNVSTLSEAMLNKSYEQRKRKESEDKSHFIHQNFSSENIARKVNKLLEKAIIKQ
ncbi:glycosyltransferase family 4 protein [Thalassotalea sp. M1531]|uniref:Glycosyltransferase family 4 protein n=1 Tax=Thalassotalea algicola TaxID=2716224 RepID=A0A7Y0Q8J1_9GAMM|nr:glycosyltransferase [Thalassotalea algicola]NMP32957.1 glycosyltransferase family 4 protein [Thalassotalea algicola]